MMTSPPPNPDPEQGIGMRGWRAQLCHQLRLFFIALQFFTRLPTPRWVGFEPDWLRHASRYFPATGIVVAALCSVVYSLLAWCLPQLLAVLLATATGIYITGALHEDGFADVCDGFGSGAQAQRVMEIMRDSRVGAFGAIGIVMLLATKIACLAYLPIDQVVPALMLAHPLSRCLAAALIWRMKYVREEGKAKPLAQQMHGVEFSIAALTVMVPAVICVSLGWLHLSSILFSLLLGLAATLFLARLFRRRIGGYTGDCLGAVQQLSEVAIYLGLLTKISSAFYL